MVGLTVRFWPGDGLLGRVFDVVWAVEVAVEVAPKPLNMSLAAVIN